jgi:hypothetical protein
MMAKTPTATQQDPMAMPAIAMPAPRWFRWLIWLNATHPKMRPRMPPMMLKKQHASAAIANPLVLG